ncbi:hypothetical protein AYI70_g1450, partial [Smittium culicis]
MSVLEKQRLYQKSSPVPIYLRGKGAKATVYGVYGLVAVGLVSTVYGTMSLIIS